MTDQRFDVVGIGNAIVDVLAHTDESFLTHENLAKGSMTLIDAERADSLYRKMGPSLEVSGGSAANTMAGLASLGGTGAYIGKVSDDTLGRSFTRDMQATGIFFDTPPAGEGPASARCLILVTPDGERTMATFLGASTLLGPGDINPETIKAAKVTYLEGYLWDPPAAKEAFVKASKLAHEAGNQVSLSLSDAFCVDRHRESFRELVRHHVDLLFANEGEILSLYGAPNFDAAMQAVRSECAMAVLTRGGAGAVVLAGNEVHEIDTEPDVSVVDTTGAGDLFAAGFLYGLTHGRDPGTSGRIGSISAAHIIGQLGPRSNTPLQDLVARTLGPQ